MEFANYLQVNAGKIEQQLNKILAKFTQDTHKISPKLSPLITQFIKSCAGGKRIRGLLVKLGYEIVKNEKNQEILKIGAALEILHTAILVHDDIVDQSPLRRGQRALFKTVGAYQALTLGDLGFFLAIKIITESNFPHKNKTQALMVLSKVMVQTALGQIMDLQKDEPALVADLKTAQYTFVGPLSLGAVLAGGDLHLIRELAKFGKNLGIAYQIKDDILDKDVKPEAITQVKDYVNRAQKIIPNLTKDQNMSRILEQLGEYLVKRTR